MPKEIVFPCGDGGVYIVKITWSKWNMNWTIGRGTLDHNACAPNYGAGNILTKEVRARLGKTAPGHAMTKSSKWALENPIAD